MNYQRIKQIAEAWKEFPDHGGYPHDIDAQDPIGYLRRRHGIHDPEVQRAWLQPGKPPEEVEKEGTDVPKLELARSYLKISARHLLDAAHRDSAPEMLEILAGDFSHHLIIFAKTANIARLAITAMNEAHSELIRAKNAYPRMAPNLHMRASLSGDVLVATNGIIEALESPDYNMETWGDHYFLLYTITRYLRDTVADLQNSIAKIRKKDEYLPSWQIVSRCLISGGQDLEQLANILYDNLPQEDPVDYTP